MSNGWRITTVSILLIIILISMFNCTPAVSQKEYDSLLIEINDYKNQLAVLQDELAEAEKLEGKYLELNIQYEELQKKIDAEDVDTPANDLELDELNESYEELLDRYNTVLGEKRAIQDTYNDLNIEYKELKRQYDNVIQGTTTFTEEEINQAIFALINQERTNNGVDELVWGTNLYKWAKQNSTEMAEQGEYQYSSAGAVWQEVFMATRYGTIEQLANAALITWKSNDYRYEYHIINSQSIYGAVATQKQGEVYYITYMASIFK